METDSDSTTNSNANSNANADGNADGNANAGKGEGENKGDDGKGEGKGDGDADGATADGKDGKGKKDKKETATAQDGATTVTDGSTSAPKQNLEAGNTDDGDEGKNGQNKGDGKDGGNAEPAKPAKKTEPAKTTDSGDKPNEAGTGTDCGSGCNGIAKDTFVEISKAIRRRDLLARACSDVIGTFDASEMTEEDVAKYAVAELGIACDSGEELATIRGYMACRAKMSSQDAVAFAADSGAELAKKGEGAAKSKSDLMKQYLG